MMGLVVIHGKTGFPKNMNVLKKGEAGIKDKLGN